MKSLPTITNPPLLDRTYWVLENQLLAGAYAGRPEPHAHTQRLEGLVRMGIRTIVNLMEVDELDPRGQPFIAYQVQIQTIASRAGYGVSCFRFPIVDQKVTTVIHMDEILDAIDESLSEKKPVYVHCFGGIGRTGTVICCWLLRHHYAHDRNVFDVLKQLRQADKQRADREAPENGMQRQFVLDWFKHSQQRTSSTVKLNDDWFTRLIGFSERSPAEVHQNISLAEGKLKSRVNGQVYNSGKLQILSLGELRRQVERISPPSGKSLALSELVADARKLHASPSNAGALFQVASQFNLLEMVGPSVTPEQGVGIYEHDATQGPACAIACGAGTIVRNYFVDLNGQIGQSADKQVDCLGAVGDLLGNTHDRLWKMQNGYALPSSAGLQEIDTRLKEATRERLDELRTALKIGIQQDTQVTLSGCAHVVTQAYCSALPVAYRRLSSRKWERFARLILEAAYEATFAASVLNAQRTGNKCVYLTLLGGGAFGNEESWIIVSVRRSTSCLGC